MILVPVVLDLNNLGYNVCPSLPCQTLALLFLEVFVPERSSIKHKLTSSGLPETMLKAGTGWNCCNGSPPPSSKADGICFVVLEP